MKQIKGKNYYISLGYINPEVREKNVGINPQDIESLFVKCKDNTVMYVDESDKEHIIAFPLIPVNEIQRKGDIFKFRTLIHPNNIEGINDEQIKMFNVIGLFSEYKNNGMQYIQHIAFYETAVECSANDTAKTISIETPVDKILG